jgi:hypothetical protein
VPLRDREAELVPRRAEPLEEQRPASDVVPQERHAALALAQTQRRDLVTGRFAVAWDDHLEDGRRPVIRRGLDHERLGRVLEGASHPYRPVALQAGDELGQPVQPPARIRRQRLVVDHSGTACTGPILPGHSRGELDAHAPTG